MYIDYKGMEELNEVSARLRYAKKRAIHEGEVIVRAHAYALKGWAITFAPVETGFLRGSIDVKFRGKIFTGGYTAIITAGAWYAGYVEYGTSRMAPHAFMGPALDRVTPSFERAIASIADPFEGVLRGGI